MFQSFRKSSIILVIKNFARFSWLFIIHDSCVWSLWFGIVLIMSIFWLRFVGNFRGTFFVQVLAFLFPNVDIYVDIFNVQVLNWIWWIIFNVSLFRLLDFWHLILRSAFRFGLLSIFLLPFQNGLKIFFVDILLNMQNVLIKFPILVKVMCNLIVEHLGTLMFIWNSTIKVINQKFFLLYLLWLLNIQFIISQ